MKVGRYDIRLEIKLTRPGKEAVLAKHTKNEVNTMWYVIQTITGKEKELVEVIDKVLNGTGYEKCFVLQRECVWRLEGRYRVHLEPLFPAYVFVETKTPEIFFFALKKVPRLAKLLGGEGEFWTVREEEKVFMERLIGKDPEHIVRRSLVTESSTGDIIVIKGVLKDFADKIVKRRLRKRMVLIEVPFLGNSRRIQLCVLLAEDEKKEIQI